MNERTEAANVGVGQSDFGALYADRGFPHDNYALAAEALHLASTTQGCGAVPKMSIDNFLATIFFTLEGFDYTKQGEAWQAVGPSLIGNTVKPLNTSGSHTSESYMQGWALHTEAAPQMRGEVGHRQVPDCSVVQYMCAPHRSSVRTYSQQSRGQSWR